MYIRGSPTQLTGGRRKISGGNLNMYKDKLVHFAVFEMAPTNFLNWMIDSHQVVTIGCARLSINRPHYFRRRIFRGKFEKHNSIYTPLLLFELAQTTIAMETTNGL